MKHLLLAMLAFLLVPAAIVAKNDKKKEKEPPHQYLVKLNDGEEVSGILSQDWVRWPAKSVNVDFKIKSTDDTEHKITVEQIDTIYDLTSGQKFVAINIHSPRLGKSGKIIKWIAECGPKSEHGEILTYVAWFSFMRGTRSEMDLARVRCMRFENDSITYPFYFPPQNGEFNIHQMKKYLKDIRPDAVEFIDKYFKQNKDLRKRLADEPGIFLEAYEKFLNQ